MNVSVAGPRETGPASGQESPLSDRHENVAGLWRIPELYSEAEDESAAWGDRRSRA